MTSEAYARELLALRRELLALQEILATMVTWARHPGPIPIIPFSEDLKRANDLLARNYHTRPPWEGSLKEGNPPPRPTMCPRCEGQRYDVDACGVCDNTGWLDENGDPWRGPMGQA